MFTSRKPGRRLRFRTGIKHGPNVPVVWRKKTPIDGSGRLTVPSSQMDPVHRALLKFSQAAGFAAVSELRLRLLADNTPALRSIAMAHNLEAVEEAILEYFDRLLSDSEKADVRAARQVRNKLLHCEFWTAERRVLNAGGSVAGGGVQMIDLLAGQNILESIRNGPRVPLREIPKTEPRIFGWIMEGAAQGGLFEEAEHMFCSAIRVTERLFMEGHTVGNA